VNLLIEIFNNVCSWCTFKLCAYITATFKFVASQSSSSDFISRGKKISTTSFGSIASGGDSINIKELSEAPLGILSNR